MEQSSYCKWCSQTKLQSSFVYNKTKCDDCHREYQRNYQRLWKQKNADTIRQRNREQYQENRLEIRRRKRAEYYQNRDWNIQRKLDWQKKNPELARLATQRRRAKKLDNGVFEVTKSDINRLLRNECFYCQSKTAKMTVDHVMPIAKGGTHSIGNIVAACVDCNLSKNSKTVMEWRMHKIRLGM